MTDVKDKIRDLQEIRGQIGSNAVEGSLLLIDLVGSTEYKTRNAEEAWLGRLIDFQEAVLRALDSIRPTKYLGDGILIFRKDGELDPSCFLDISRQILNEISVVNADRPYPAGHAIRIRIVLSHGRVFLFEKEDPQGTAVDKLFRMEKYVPMDCIGMTEEFVGKTNPTEMEKAGKYRLKGLAGGRHELFLLGKLDQRTSRELDSARRRAALYDVWDLGAGGEGKIYLVRGYIPSREGQPSTIQSGDMEATLRAYKNLVSVGRLGDTTDMTSYHVQEEFLRENVVCIGGPYWNRITLKFMQKTGSPFAFDFSDADDDATPIKDCLTRETHAVTRTEGRLTRDVGFFAKFRNPYNEDRHVILACGIETAAVLGAVKAFSEDQNDFLTLHDALVGGVERTHAQTNELVDFFALMKFGVEYTGDVHLPTGEEQVSRLIFDWATGHDGTSQQPSPD